jgi:hypothetical protein
VLGVNDNALSGTIGLLAAGAPALTYFYAHHNKFQGTIPVRARARVRRVLPQRVSRSSSPALAACARRGDGVARHTRSR